MQGLIVSQVVESQQQNKMYKMYPIVFGESIGLLWSTTQQHVNSWYWGFYEVIDDVQLGYCLSYYVVNPFKLYLHIFYCFYSNRIKYSFSEYLQTQLFLFTFSLDYALPSNLPLSLPILVSPLSFPFFSLNPLLDI